MQHHLYRQDTAVVGSQQVRWLGLASTRARATEETGPRGREGGSGDREKHGQHFQQSLGQPGMVANPACGQLTRENNIFSVPVHA